MTTERTILADLPRSVAEKLAEAMQDWFKVNCRMVYPIGAENPEIVVDAEDVTNNQANRMALWGQGFVNGFTMGRGF